MVQSDMLDHLVHCPGLQVVEDSKAIGEVKEILEDMRVVTGMPVVLVCVVILDIQEV